MRGAVIGSGVVHVMVLAALFVVRQAEPIVIPGPDVVQVSLLDLPGPTVPPPPTPVEKPEIKEPEVTPTDDTGIELKKPKPKPKQSEAPREEPAPSPPAALPWATAGTPGLRSQVALDARDFEFTYYLVQVRNKIVGNWTPPGGTGAGGVRAVVYFRIGRDGSIRGIQIETSSRYEYFDRSAQRAVTISDPLPPLPLGWSGAELGVHFGFEYAGP